MPSPRDRAFSPDGFTPLGTPRPGDWLAEHPERGQSFEQFVASRPNRPNAERRTIYLVALGGASAETRDLVPKMVDYAGRFFAMPARALPAIVLDDGAITERTNPRTGQRQLLTSDILDALRQRLPDDAYCLIAFTDVDLYPEPTWNFVFGQASLVDRVGVYSVARYQPRVESRGLKVMAHEVGHMFGLAHCVHYQCVMNGSNHLEESDRRPHHLCPECLRKLHWSIGFDAAERYRQLEAFYRDAGMIAEADFVAARRAALE